MSLAALVEKRPPGRCMEGVLARTGGGRHALAVFGACTAVYEGWQVTANWPEFLNRIAPVTLDLAHSAAQSRARGRVELEEDDDYLPLDFGCQCDDAVAAAVATEATAAEERSCPPSGDGPSPASVAISSVVGAAAQAAWGRLRARWRRRGRRGRRVESISRSAPAWDEAAGEVQ